MFTHEQKIILKVCGVIIVVGLTVLAIDRWIVKRYVDTTPFDPNSIVIDLPPVRETGLSNQLETIRQNTATAIASNLAAMSAAQASNRAAFEQQRDIFRARMNTLTGKTNEPSPAAP